MALPVFERAPDTAQLLLPSVGLLVARQARPPRQRQLAQASTTAVRPAGRCVGARVRRSKTSGPGIGGTGYGSPTIGLSQSLARPARNSNIGRAVRCSGRACARTPTARPAASRTSRSPSASSLPASTAPAWCAAPGTRTAAPSAPRGRRSRRRRRRRAPPCSRPARAGERLRARWPGSGARASRDRRSAPTGPTSADSSPAGWRRCRSIWKKRSCAWTNPMARARSTRDCARIVGTPSASRVTVTGCASPASVSDAVRHRQAAPEHHAQIPAAGERRRRPPPR